METLRMIKEDGDFYLTNGKIKTSLVVNKEKRVLVSEMCEIQHLLGVGITKVPSAIVIEGSNHSKTFIFEEENGDHYVYGEYVKVGGNPFIKIPRNHTGWELVILND